jgi:hypothetical protein
MAVMMVSLARRDTMADLRVTTVKGTDAVLKETAVEAFRTSLRGGLLRATDAGYETSRQVWNANIDRRPGLICRPAGVADVFSAVTFAVTTTCWWPCGPAAITSLAMRCALAAS